ncbi:MAG: SDR family oxidoreductase [Alphaproteobacteria bacterium]|nr:SDR family oxidoreductase [Alphaproteobacteria bacterium]
MKVLITGAGGFLGRKLATRLAADGAMGIDGKPHAIERLILADLIAPEAPPANFEIRCEAADVTSPSAAAHLVGKGVDVVFHLAAIVSADAEANFDKGMSVNFDATRHLLQACRANGGARLVFASSVAVYGRTPDGVIREDTWPQPQTSYGSQKIMGEVLVGDMSRKGFVDGRSVRLPTVVVRPGKPNKAASTFASSIIREPLQGDEALLPVGEDAAMYVASPRRIVENLLIAADLPSAAWGTDRSLMLPGVTVSVADMLATLEAVGGAEARTRVRRERDPAVEKIVAGWPSVFEIDRARRMGFEADESYRAIVEAFMEDDMVR